MLEKASKIRRFYDDEIALSFLISIVFKAKNPYKLIL